MWAGGCPYRGRAPPTPPIHCSGCAAHFGGFSSCASLICSLFCFTRVFAEAPGQPQCCLSLVRKQACFPAASSGICARHALHWLRVYPCWPLTSRFHFQNWSVCLLSTGAKHYSIQGLGKPIIWVTLMFANNVTLKIRYGGYCKKVTYANCLTQLTTPNSQATSYQINESRNSQTS